MKFNTAASTIFSGLPAALGTTVVIERCWQDGRGGARTAPSTEVPQVVLGAIVIGRSSRVGLSQVVVPLALLAVQSWVACDE